MCVEWSFVVFAPVSSFVPPMIPLTDLVDHDDPSYDIDVRISIRMYPMMEHCRRMMVDACAVVVVDEQSSG